MRGAIKSLNLISIEVSETSRFCLFIVKLLDADIKTTTSPFLYLALDLPPPPLFQDSVEKNIIPQVSIASVLSKFDGKTTQVVE